MATWLRVVLTVVGGLVGVMVFVVAEISFIGFIGGQIEGTAIVALLLAPIAAIVGAALGAWLSWRLLRRRANRAAS